MTFPSRHKIIRRKVADRLISYMITQLKGQAEAHRSNSRRAAELSYNYFELTYLGRSQGLDEAVIWLETERESLRRGEWDTLATIT